MHTFSFRHTLTGPVLGIVLISLVGCGGGGGAGSNNLDGVYQGISGGPITITIKDSKATVQIGNESKTLDYKVERNQLTIINPEEGDMVLTINDDGTLNSEIGIMTRTPR